jgi:hypothetical protein
MPFAAAGLAEGRQADQESAAVRARQQRQGSPGIAKRRQAVDAVDLSWN